MYALFSTTILKFTILSKYSKYYYWSCTLKGRVASEVVVQGLDFTGTTPLKKTCVPVICFYSTESRSFHIVQTCIIRNFYVKAIYNLRTRFLLVFSSFFRYFLSAFVVIHSSEIHFQFWCQCPILYVSACPLILHNPKKTNYVIYEQRILKQP